MKTWERFPFDELPDLPIDQRKLKRDASTPWDRYLLEMQKKRDRRELEIEYPDWLKAEGLTDRDLEDLIE